MKHSKAALMLVAISLVTVACSSGSGDTTVVPTPTTVGSATTTSSTAATTTTATTALVDDLTVTIVEPRPLSTFLATIDLGNGRLSAPVRLEADVEVPPGESVEIAWASDIDGPLGGGAVLDAELSNDRRDIVSHIVSVTAASTGGSRGTATVEVIVRVESN